MKPWLKGGIIGGIFGVLIWLYDYDFLLNAGGPETPISDFIGSLFKVTFHNFGSSFWFIPVFFPLLILIITFGIIGISISLLIRKYK